MFPVKILIRLRECAGKFEENISESRMVSSHAAHVRLYFSDVAAHIIPYANIENFYIRLHVYENTVCHRIYFLTLKPIGFVRNQWRSHTLWLVILLCASNVTNIYGYSQERPHSRKTAPQRD